PLPQGVAMACGAAGPAVVGGGKHCRRSATALAAWRQQRPTANSEALTSPACCQTSRRLMPLGVSMKAFQMTILRPTLTSAAREFDDLNGKKNSHRTFAGGSRCAVVCRSAGACG